MEKYSDKFFARQKVDSYQSAQIVVPNVLSQFAVKSVIDVGCGVGAWLKVFADNGVSHYTGLDGTWVNPAELLIPKINFVSRNLELDFTDIGQFDLAVCLELAEHLPATSADKLIKFLTDLAPVILFSAAIPGQDLPGAMHHVNEQWPEYWADKFFIQGFRPLDFLRDKIWFDKRVKYWYQQNILLYVNQRFLSEHQHLAKYISDPNQLSRVHPKTYQAALAYYQSKSNH